MRIFSKAGRRSITPIVLALWLFALAASMAQACGIGEGVGHAGMAKPASVATHQESTGDVPGCKQFCADDTPLLTKLKAVDDSPAGATLLAGALAFATPIEGSARTFKPRSGLDPPPGIAISTRFVRLAL